MKYLKNLILALFFCAGPVFAAPPSDASIKQLLTVTEAQKGVDGFLGQMESRMNAALQQAVQNGKITQEQQKLIAKKNTKVMAILKEDLSWKTMEPIFIKLYKEALTQEEVNGIIAFYKTPAGQAVLKKIPGVLQASVHEIQNRLRVQAPKIQQIEQDLAAEIKALQDKQQNKPQGK